jgi:hypothetical protein
MGSRIKSKWVVLHLSQCVCSLVGTMSTAEKETHWVEIYLYERANVVHASSSLNWTLSWMPILGGPVTVRIAQ